MNKVFTFIKESQTARFMLPIGLVLFVFGIILFIITLNNQNYIKTEATIIDIEEVQETNYDEDGANTTTVYNATLKYTVDKKEYTQTLDNISKHKVGDKMIIYYNPDNPYQITQTKSFIIPIILLASAVVLITGGIISTVNVSKKHQKI